MCSSKSSTILDNRASNLSMEAEVASRRSCNASRSAAASARAASTAAASFSGFDGRPRDLMCFSPTPPGTHGAALLPGLARGLFWCESRAARKEVNSYEAVGIGTRVARQCRADVDEQAAGAASSLPGLSLALQLASVRDAAGVSSRGAPRHARTKCAEILVEIFGRTKHPRVCRNRINFHRVFDLAVGSRRSLGGSSCGAIALERRHPTLDGEYSTVGDG